MKEKFDKALGAIYKSDNELLKSQLLELDGLNYTDTDGKTLIFYTVLDNNIEAVSLLLSKRVNINIKDKNGWTPLHYAVNEHLVDITKILIEYGSNVNAKDSYGNTIISRAVFASKGRGDIIHLLLQNGSDPLVENDSGVSALSLAKTIDNYDVIQFFN